ncbi:MAG: hypothetical protein K6F20_02380 [Bacteroidaceae bacterium]|jgi:hypothetical protein|nr:hypothetical protein [Bacteroidaceae bacterium]
MYKHLLTASLFTVAISALAQGPWKMILTCPEEKIDLVMNLYKEDIEVPGMEMFGPMNGYLGGNIYGVWSITSFKIDSDKNVSLRVSNDLGSETQAIQITQQNDSVWRMEFTGHNVIKRVNGKKLVKIPSVFLMKKKE